MNELNNNDYKNILIYYNLPIPKSNHFLKKSAETILSNKLCRCIKKIKNVKDENKVIGICTKTIINRKGFTRGKFNCKGKIKSIKLNKNITRKNKITK